MSDSIKVGSLLLMSKADRIRTKIKITKKEIDLNLYFEYDDFTVSYIPKRELTEAELKGRKYILACLENELMTLVPF